MTAPLAFARPATLMAVAIVASATAAQAAPTYGKLLVEQFDDGNDSTSVNVTATVDRGDLYVTSANKGDYSVSFGNFGAGYDFPVGIPITTVRENLRDNSAAGSPYGPRFATSVVSGRPEGDFPQYYISTFLTGNPSNYTPATGTTAAVNPNQRDGGSEFNINVAVGFFNYSEHLAGFAYNSLGTNGGDNDALIASPGIALGTHVINKPGGANGVSTVNLTSLGASSRNGILLVNHAKNEDNFALSQANADGTFTVYVKDNGADAGSNEQDPFAFVYIAKDDANVQAMGRVRFDRSAEVSSGDWTLTNPTTGTYLLKIRGQDDDTGTLLVTPAGGESNNRDNIVSYQWSATDGGWLIQSRDLPNGGLQGNATINEAAFNFAFLSTNVVPVVPEPTTIAAFASLAILVRRRRA